MKRGTSTLLAAALAVGSACAQSYPNPISGVGQTNCRDPAMTYRPETKTYYMFSTGQGMKIFKAPAITGPWTLSGYVMPNNCSIVDNPGRCDLWAGDIARIGGQYVLYYSASQVGSANAVIGVATSATMDPGSWTDHGEVIRSDGSLGFIAIDPNIIDANGLKLQFGSHILSLFQIEMTDFKTPKTKLPGKHIAGHNGREAEGGFLYKSPDSPYYFIRKTRFSRERPNPSIVSLALPPAVMDFMPGSRWNRGRSERVGLPALSGTCCLPALLSTPQVRIRVSELEMFFFFSDGVTLFGGGRPPAGDEYKVRVGRSMSPSGPFLDKTGDDLTKNMPESPSGSIVLASHDNIYAPGGQSLFRDTVSNRDVMAYHWVSNSEGGAARLGTNYIDFKSGWPTVITAPVVKPS
ncbi:Arabinanase/levansucrase/invertase [Auricularia subglabra TFB-10046 SS5]|nr:Arabinanase/levansucrase/invertase [Auricularia subglabra TFB-10046 SS5]